MPSGGCGGRARNQRLSRAGDPGLACCRDRQPVCHPAVRAASVPAVRALPAPWAFEPASTSGRGDRIVGGRSFIIQRPGDTVNGAPPPVAHLACRVPASRLRTSGCRIGSPFFARLGSSLGKGDTGLSGLKLRACAWAFARIAETTRHERSRVDNRAPEVEQR